jgi:hypothetical protein
MRGKLRREKSEWEKEREIGTREETQTIKTLPVLRDGLAVCMVLYI